MADLHVDRAMLETFESGLDLRRPERGDIPARILAHGKGCTILAIEHEKTAGLVFKRVAIFRKEEEAGRYEATLRRYVRSLGQRAGVRVASCTTEHIHNPGRDRWIVYIIQERMPEATLGHRVIGDLPPNEMNRLAVAVLTEAAKVFDFNNARRDDLELGFDGRISNWSVVGFDRARCELPDRPKLSYLDVGTPLMRQHGVEQFDPTPFLRAFPVVTLPFVRRALLADMMTRYYDFRRVALDLLSSILKQGYGDFVKMLADSVNWFFLAERQEMHFQPITVHEVILYHRRDTWRWQAYLRLRR